MESAARPIPVSEPEAHLPVQAENGQHNAVSRPRAVRNRLPDERMSVTHKFSVGGHEGYITVGLYPDGVPGEVFITMAKEGSTVSGLISSFAQALSIALQHGVSLEIFCDKFSHTRFEPSGWTGNPEIRHATSVMDYVFRWMRLRFIGGTQNPAPGPSYALPGESISSQASSASPPTLVVASDAPSCRHCGSLTKRNGSCFICENCGASTGCS